MIFCSEFRYISYCHNVKYFFNNSKLYSMNSFNLFILKKKKRIHFNKI